MQNRITRVVVKTLDVLQTRSNKTNFKHLKVWLHVQFLHARIECNSCSALQESQADQTCWKILIDSYKPRRPESQIIACKNCACSQTLKSAGTACPTTNLMQNQDNLRREKRDHHPTVMTFSIQAVQDRDQSCKN